MSATDPDVIRPSPGPDSPKDKHPFTGQEEPQLTEYQEDQESDSAGLFVSREDTVPDSEDNDSGDDNLIPQNLHQDSPALNNHQTSEPYLHHTGGENNGNAEDAEEEDPYPRRNIANYFRRRPAHVRPPSPSPPPPPPKPMKVRKKPGPKPTRPPPIMKNDIVAKKKMVKQIEAIWGPGFIKKYIPKCHRPLVKRKPGHSRAIPRRDESQPMKWAPSVLKSILQVARITQDRALLKRLMANVVKYRIRHTGNKKPQLVTTDFDVIEDMILRKWKLKDSFEVRYKHLLMDRPEQNGPVNEEALNEYFKHLFGKDNNKDDANDDEDNEGDCDEDQQMADEEYSEEEDGDDDGDDGFENEFELSNDFQTASGYNDGEPSPYEQPNPYQDPTASACNYGGGGKRKDDSAYGGAAYNTDRPNHRSHDYDTEVHGLPRQDTYGYPNSPYSMNPPPSSRRRSGLFASMATPRHGGHAQDEQSQAPIPHRPPYDRNGQQYSRGRHGSTPDIPLSQVRNRLTPAQSTLTGSSPANTTTSITAMDTQSSLGTGENDEVAFIRAQLQLAEANALKAQLTLELIKSQRAKGSSAGSPSMG